MKTSSIKSKIIYTLFSFFVLSSVLGQQLLGDWHAKLEIPGGDLLLKFTFEETPNGWKGFMSVPQQNAQNIPLTEVVFSERKLTFSLPAARISYEGAWDDQKKEWNGTFTQGMRFPLILQRKEIELKPQLRPQEPKEPFTYISENINYKQEKENFTIGGTLTFPKQTKPLAAIILISGSGQQDRNSEIFNHKPFWVIADYLSRNGYAVLRYDDRGVGDTGGKVETATSENFADDVRAGIMYLKSRKEINPKKIYLAGHSEGGILALLASQNNPDVAGIISLAGLGIPGHELLIKQSYLIAQASGLSGAILEKSQNTNKAIYDLILKNTPESELRIQVTKLFKDSGLITDDNAIEQQFQMINSPWFRYFVKFDPAPYLAQIKFPMLVLNGEKDLQVPYATNIEGFQKAFAASGHKKYEVKTYPQLNHLFQTAQTGLVDEYGKIEETFNELVLTDIKTWLDKQTGRK